MTTMIGKTALVLMVCLLAIAMPGVTSVRPALAGSPCYGVCQLEAAGSAVQGSHTAVVTRMKNHEEMFWVAPDGSVQDTYTYGGGSWNTFTLAPKGSAATCSGWPITAVSRNVHTMEVFWLGADGSVNDASWYDTIGWSGLGSNPRLPLIAPAGSAEVLGYNTTCPGLTSISRSSDRLEVLWVAYDYSIQDASWLAGYSWQHHAPITGSGTTAGVSQYVDGGITAVSRAGNTIELFWIGWGGLSPYTINHAWYYDGADWSAPAPLFTSQSGHAYSSLAVVSRRPDTMEVFWVDLDGSIQDAWWYASVGQWQQAARTGANAVAVNYYNHDHQPTGPSLAAVAPEPSTGNSMMVFFTAGDGSVQDLEWYQGTGPWHQYTAAAPGSNTAKTFNSISVVHAAANDTVDVFWIDDDGSIQQAYW
jgi:hypothetical protein